MVVKVLKSMDLDVVLDGVACTEATAPNRLGMHTTLARRVTHHYFDGQEF